VIASLTSAWLALVVAEPTPSGAHDAVRVMELARQLRVRTALCVNRWDLNPALTAELEHQATNLGTEPVGRVREDPAMVHSQMQGISVTELAHSPAADDVRRIWSRLKVMGLCSDRHESPSLLQGATREDSGTN
jgi:MinD superfamily P-loop ATPase